MADNVKFQTPRPATAPGGTIVATDKIAGVDFQRVKMTLGNDGVDSGDISSINPMPTTSLLLDENGLPFGIKQFDNRPLVLDENVEVLLHSVIKELKIMNLHLSLMTDTNINRTEVE